MALRFPEWIEYTKRMNSHVKFKFDHEAIRDEYLEHMEDMYEFYVGRGMDPDLAKSAVLEDMGDPDELGRVLNQIHNPVLGWIWRLSRWLIAFMVLLVIYPTVVLFGSSAISLIQDYRDISVSAPLVQEIDIGALRTLDNEGYYFDKLELYEDGTAILYCLTWANPFDRATYWQPNLPGGGFYDEEGMRYLAMECGNGNAGFVGKRVYYIEGFPLDAETFIYDYQNGDRKLHVEVLIASGKVVES